MDDRVKSSLEAGGWKVGTAAAFLEETPAESALADVTLALADALRDKREILRLSQAEVAKRLRVRTADVARLELGADRTVTVDELLRALFDLGVEPAVIGALLVDRFGAAQAHTTPHPPPQVNPATRRAQVSKPRSNSVRAGQTRRRREAAGTGMKQA